MPQRNSRGGAVAGIASVVFAILGFVAMLLVELIAAMFTYGYLQLAHTNLFGWLVRQANGVLQVVAAYIDTLFPSQANQIYATTFGELGPKSILLLLIGLVVGAIFRLLVWGIVRLARRSA